MSGAIGAAAVVAVSVLAGLGVAAALAGAVASLRQSWKARR